MKALTDVQKKKLNEIAAWLEAGAPHVETPFGKTIVGFDMSMVERLTDCGTVCCIAGYAEQMWPSEDPDHITIHGDQNSLFMPPDYDSDSKPYPADRVARVLRNYIATDRLEWIA